MNVQMRVHVLRTVIIHLLVHMLQKTKIALEIAEKTVNGSGLNDDDDEKQYLFRDVQLSNSWFKWSPGTKLQIQTMTKTYTKLQNLTCYTTVLYQMYLALRNFLRSILNLGKLVSVLSLKGNIFHVFAPLYRNEF